MRAKGGTVDREERERRVESLGVRRDDDVHGDHVISPPQRPFTDDALDLIATDTGADNTIHYGIGHSYDVNVHDVTFASRGAA